MTLSDEYIAALMDRLRVKNSSAADEVAELAQSCLNELAMAGVYVTDPEDPLALQAVKLYCRAHFGYDSDVDRFREAYANLRDAMALSGDYKEEE